jgi:hypothetical protein
VSSVVFGCEYAFNVIILGVDELHGGVLVVPRLMKQFPGCFIYPRVHCPIHKRFSLDCIFKAVESSPCLTPCFFKIHFSTRLGLIQFSFVRFSDVMEIHTVSYTCT